MVSESIKGLDFHDDIRLQLRILNEVLRVHSKTELFDNADIQFDSQWCSENFLRFALHRPNTNSVTLEFHLSSDGLRLDFEGFSEAWEISAAAAAKDQRIVKEVLERLLSCPILVEYKGRAMFVNLFNRDGSRFAIWALQSFTAIALGGYWKSQAIRQHLFDPIYPTPNTIGLNVGSTRS